MMLGMYSLLDHEPVAKAPLICPLRTIDALNSGRCLTAVSTIFSETYLACAYPWGQAKSGFSRDASGTGPGYGQRPVAAIEEMKVMWGGNARVEDRESSII